MRRHYKNVAFILAVLLPAGVQGDLINFETGPAGDIPVDNAPLTAPYIVSDGAVRFFFDVNGNNTFDVGDVNPVFEASGAADAAPQGFGSRKLMSSDVALPGFGDLGK